MRINVTKRSSFERVLVADYDPNQLKINSAKVAGDRKYRSLLAKFDLDDLKRYEQDQFNKKMDCAKQIRLELGSVRSSQKGKDPKFLQRIGDEAHLFLLIYFHQRSVIDHNIEDELVKLCMSSDQVFIKKMWKKERAKTEDGSIYSKLLDQFKDFCLDTVNRRVPLSVFDEIDFDYEPLITPKSDHSSKHKLKDHSVNSINGINGSRKVSSVSHDGLERSTSMSSKQSSGFSTPQSEPVYRKPSKSPSELWSPPSDLKLKSRKMVDRGDENKRSVSDYDVKNMLLSGRDFAMTAVTEMQREEQHIFAEAPPADSKITQQDDEHIFAQAPEESEAKMTAPESTEAQEHIFAQAPELKTQFPEVLDLTENDKLTISSTVIDYYAIKLFGWVGAKHLSEIQKNDLGKIIRYELLNFGYDCFKWVAETYRASLKDKEKKNAIERFGHLYDLKKCSQDGMDKKANFIPFDKVELKQHVNLSKVSEKISSFYSWHKEIEQAVSVGNSSKRFYANMIKWLRLGTNKFTIPIFDQEIFWKTELNLGEIFDEREAKDLASKVAKELKFEIDRQESFFILNRVLATLTQPPAVKKQLGLYEYLKGVTESYIQPLEQHQSFDFKKADQIVTQAAFYLYESEYGQIGAFFLSDKTDKVPKSFVEFYDMLNAFLTHVLKSWLLVGTQIVRDPKDLDSKTVAELIEQFNLAVEAANAVIIKTTTKLRHTEIRLAKAKEVKQNLHKIKKVNESLSDVGVDFGLDPRDVMGHEHVESKDSGITKVPDPEEADQEEAFSYQEIISRTQKTLQSYQSAVDKLEFLKCENNKIIGIDREQIVALYPKAFVRESEVSATPTAVVISSSSVETTSSSIKSKDVSEMVQVSSQTITSSSVSTASDTGSVSAVVAIGSLSPSTLGERDRVRGCWKESEPSVSNGISASTLVDLTSSSASSATVATGKDLGSQSQTVSGDVHITVSDSPLIDLKQSDPDHKDESQTTHVSSVHKINLVSVLNRALDNYQKQEYFRSYGYDAKNKDDLCGGGRAWQNRRRKSAADLKEILEVSSLNLNSLDDKGKISLGKLVAYVIGGKGNWEASEQGHCSLKRFIVDEFIKEVKKTQPEQHHDSLISKAIPKSDVIAQFKEYVGIAMLHEKGLSTKDLNEQKQVLELFNTVIYADALEKIPKRNMRMKKAANEIDDFIKLEEKQSTVQSIKATFDQIYNGKLDPDDLATQKFFTTLFERSGCQCLFSKPKSVRKMKEFLDMLELRGPLIPPV